MQYNLQSNEKNLKTKKVINLENEKNNQNNQIKKPFQIVKDELDSHSKFGLISAEDLREFKILETLNSEDPMDYIDIAKKAVVFQLIDKKVFKTTCDPPIRYLVEIESYMGEQKIIFMARETPRWLQKNCCE